jgi:hypothetical protein
MNKGRSNDHDFVPPTQYKSSRTKQPRPSLLSQLELIPKFEAMELENAKGFISESSYDWFQQPCVTSLAGLLSQGSLAKGVVGSVQAYSEEGGNA